MKYILVLVLFINVQAHAQKTYTYRDTIFTTIGEVLIGRIGFMAEDSIFYNYYLPDSTLKSTVIARSEVERTGLSPKRAEILGAEDKHINKLSWPPGQKYALKGSKDAEKYYDDYSSAGTGTLVVALISPALGLIPAIATSSTTPKDKNLSYPNARLMENPDYRNGYIKKAKRMKQGRVWTNWGIAFGVNLIAVILLSSSTAGAQ